MHFNARDPITSLKATGVRDCLLCLPALFTTWRTIRQHFLQVEKIQTRYCPKCKPKPHLTQPDLWPSPCDFNGDL